MNGQHGKRIFLVWKPNCTRSSNIAGHFDADIVFISYFDHGKSLLQKVGRYILSFFATFKVLFGEKPDTVLLINNPPFLMLAVFLYTRFSQATFVLDSHSGPFNDPKWQWFRPLYRIISARALLNINTNEVHKKLVESWGGRSEIIGDVPIDHQKTYPETSVKKPAIMVVCSFMFDEPIREIIDAVTMSSDVNFYMTGDYESARRGLLENLPPNVTLTGYVSVDDYFGLMQSVQGVMVLTKRDDTMQRGAYEALSLDVPIITSDWGILRTSFGNGAVYVDNTAGAIHEGVQELIQNLSLYQENIVRQRQFRRERFEAVKSSIETILDRH